MLDGLEGVLDFLAKMLVCKIFGDAVTQLEQLAAGHLALRLIPDAWPELGKGRRRRLGPDGVLEVILDCSRLMQVRSRAQSADAKLEGNSRNMTEASLELGRLAYDFHSVLAVLAQSNMYGDVVAEFSVKFMTRWRRVVLRLWHRARWSYKGVLLWFVRQPGLRFLPWPYPSVSSVAQWRTQAEAMIESRCYPRKWLVRASFTASNLSLLAWGRGGVGLLWPSARIRFKFGWHADGPTTPWKDDATQECCLEGGGREAGHREGPSQGTLLGPRGGLPTLVKGDLVKLAQLLRTEVSEN